MEARDHDVDDPSEVVGALRALHGHAGEGASFIERIFGTPAKEATVPNLVPVDKLATANSLELAAAYGTFPLAAGLFALLEEVAEWLGGIDAFDTLHTSQEAVAFYANVVCYLAAALIIYRLAIPRDHIRTHDDRAPIDLGQVFKEVKEGWHTRSSLRWCGRSTWASRAGSSAASC
jgi:hypothetical protein